MSFMKNMIIVFFFISYSLISQVQIKDNLRDVNKDFRINFPMLFINQTFCLIYEKNIQKNISFGLEGSINMSGDGMIHNHGWSETMSLKYFHRIYINSQKVSKGLFAGIFSRLVYGENENFILKVNSFDFRSNEYLIRDNSKFIDLAFGLDFGHKWLVKKNWIFELYMGFGEFIFDRDKDILLKGGITIGKALCKNQNK